MNDLAQIQTIDDYFREFSHFHVRKATELLRPLHTPGVGFAVGTAYVIFPLLSWVYGEHTLSTNSPYPRANSCDFGHGDGTPTYI